MYDVLGFSMIDVSHDEVTGSDFAETYIFLQSQAKFTAAQQ